MARAIWKGIITFGMVSIPMKLYSATSSQSVSFHLVHKKCNSRIKEQRFCPHCDEVVEYADVEKGYEYSKGEYVKLTETDFEELPLPNKHTIEVTDFVHVEEIDPIYYDKTYYVDPDPAAKKPFALFMKAIEDKSVFALGKVALRSKERLCCLRPIEGSLVVTTLLYPDEITIDLDKKLPNVSISDKELDMAEKLVDMMTSDFDPEKYTDRYREALLELIEAKVEGKEIESAPEPKKKGEVIDLLDALQASMKKFGSTDKKKTSAIGKRSTAAKAPTKKTAKTTTKTTHSKTSAAKSSREAKVASNTKRKRKAPARKRKAS
jgi:DNA end-binding protein Ku